MSSAGLKPSEHEADAPTGHRESLWPAAPRMCVSQIHKVSVGIEEIYVHVAWCAQGSVLRTLEQGEDPFTSSPDASI